ncbi:hypothetical protein TTHERM_01028860 (macronuclear) [Tetrahymena thermophila SB210]|uniref:Uncharacterized protein n=1 Tax=Tetrahymena thermophila (strain SB210) TaxID=312017 RepID=Q23EF4_TETTS|nr:hypothetical protein TTHERM_01028860 [Tetrahymena thermophila SB210]EAR94903.2 hypothetical protein TTHERM_01028860 [Tetrahymena thermophila SB210]|eukprot:XP_001015148.2 hypothetical protein TTHERM_01028860 [Tetrahymena thermophila SB210]
MIEQYSSIESGDGFIYQIFKSLWKVDSVLKKILLVNIPDTIMFQNGGIYSWYFSMDSQVYFKKKQNLEKEQILNKFSTNIPPCGIVAVWIYKQEIQNVRQKGEQQYSYQQNSSTRYKYSSQEDFSPKKSFSDMSSKEINSSTTSKLIYQYMNLEQLNEFLIKARPGEMIDGILQKFIQSKGDNNSVIQVTWNREFYLSQKISNPNQINDTNLDIYQRVITFESDNQSLTTDLKGHAINSYFQTKIEEIVKHVENTYEKPITISLFKGIFKIDPKGKIWFLQCKTLSVCQKMNQEYKTLKETSKSLPFIETDIPSYISKVKSAIGKGIDLQSKEICKKCLEEVELNGMYMVEYDHIIKSWQFDHVGEKEKKKEQSEQKYLEEREKLEKMYKLLDKLDLDVPQDFPKITDQDEKRFDVNPNYIIPRVIRNQEPELSEEQYLSLVNNPGFRSRAALICENCCLHIMNSINWKENPSKLKIKALNDKKYFGVGELKPETIIARYNKTRKQVELKKIFEEELNPNSVNKEIMMRFKRMDANSNPPEERTDFPLRMTDIFSRTGIKQNRRHQQYLSGLGISEISSYQSKLADQREQKLSFLTNPPQLNTPSTVFDEQANSKMSQVNTSQFAQKNSVSTCCLSPHSAIGIIQDHGVFNESIKIYAKTLSKNSLQKFLIPIDNRFKASKEKNESQQKKFKSKINNNNFSTQENNESTLTQTLKPLKHVSLHKLQNSNKIVTNQTQPGTLQILTDRSPTSEYFESILTSRSKDKKENTFKQSSDKKTKQQKRSQNNSCIDALSKVSENQSKLQENKQKAVESHSKEHYSQLKIQESQQKVLEPLLQLHESDIDDNEKLQKLRQNQKQKPKKNLNSFHNNFQAYLTSIVLPNSSKGKKTINIQQNHFKSQSVQIPKLNE